MLLRFRLDKTACEGTHVTQRFCNLACIWCHHDYFLHNDFKAIGNSHFSEIVGRVIHATSADDVYVRLAGDGDPTIVGVDELEDLARRLHCFPQVSKLALTTNGVLLGRMAAQIKRAGYSSVTVSLNSMSSSGYARYTQRSLLPQVFDSLYCAFREGINLKINVIYSRWNHDDVEAYERLSCSLKGVPIKFFDLLVQSKEDQEIFLPLADLETQLRDRAVSVTEKQLPYAKRVYVMPSGAVFEVKIAGAKNTCPNWLCSARSRCLEGCRHSIRIGLDGVLRPCGVRDDNVLDMNRVDVSDQEIRNALRSGGKL
jgi:cyclic pyranopterin phosphate synthase